MNYSILKKILDELNKDKPDNSYLRGMVETLLSLQDRSLLVESSTQTSPVVPSKRQSGDSIVSGIPLGNRTSLSAVKEIVEKSQ